MRAVRFSRPCAPLTLEEVPRPVIAANEMLVKVSHCGICGTDIHASRAGPFKAPEGTIFGHEFSGEIVEIGADLLGRHFDIGDRVTSLPFIGERTIGLGAVDGAYADFVKVGYDLVVKLPDAIDNLSGALVEPLAVGLHSVKMAGSISGKSILIIGAGPIGLSCAIWCRFFGAASVVLCDGNPARRDIAKKFGFDSVIDTVTSFAGKAPDVQFECVGASGIMQSCIERAPKLGIIMGIGVCDQPDTIVPLQAFGKELRIQWAVGYDKEDFEYSIEMMLAGRIDPTPMLTDTVSMHEVPASFERLKSPGNQCKVMIDMGR